MIIAGSHSFTNYSLLCKTLEDLFPHPITIVSGHARGADKLGEAYAQAKGYDVLIMPAEWDKYGKSAGYRRNSKMAEQADALIAFWDGQSRGTYHMINLAKAKGLPVHVVSY